MCLAFLVLCIKLCLGFPGGAPDMACETMVPGHGNYTPQTSNSPYNIIVRKKSYSPGETIPVLFTGGTRLFKGLYVQARSLKCSKNDTKVNLIGQFTTMDFDLQTRHCFGGLHNAVTQSVPKAKNLKKIYWTAPVKPAGHVIFRGTFVKDYVTFWTDVYSDILVDLSSSVHSPECILKYKKKRPLTKSVNYPAISQHTHHAHAHSLSDIVGDLDGTTILHFSPSVLLTGLCFFFLSSLACLYLEL